MAKNRKSNDALWMAILQMLQGGDVNESTAVAVAAMSDISRDKADQGDMHNIVANTMFVQNNDPVSFIMYIFEQHPEMMDELDEYMEEKGITINTIEELLQVIQMFLKEVRHYGEGGQFESPNEFIDIEIAGKSYHLLNLVTEEQKERGLMDVESMESNEGALFDYSDDPQASIDFWMKDTTIPLDIIFINEDGVVISVKQGVPNSEDYISESSDFVAYVVELNINSGVQAGDETSLGKSVDLSGLEPGKLYMLNENGEVQAELAGGERIFSRKNSRTILNIAARYIKTGNQVELKRLGKKIFEYMKQQDERDPEYVEN